MLNFRRTAIAVLGLVLVTMAGGWAYVNLPRPGATMTQAAVDFLKVLDDKQRQQAVLAYDSPKRVGWHFIPKPQRKGVMLGDLDAAQRRAAGRVIASSLSELGYERAMVIMSLEKILGELEKNPKRRNPLKYYLTFFGQPEPDSRWGLSIEGHHLSLNFVVEDNNVVAHTPAFFGSNPATVQGDYNTGPEQGTQVLAKFEDLAFKLVGLLNANQRKVAIIAEKAPRDIRAAGKAQPPKEPPVGLPAGEMTAEQKMVLRSLVGAYAENLPAQLAQAQLKEIDQSGFHKLHFAWAGAEKPGIGHYYRIQGPTVLLEACNVQPDPAGNPANHLHSIWRDMRGDFHVRIDAGHD